MANNEEMPAACEDVLNVVSNADDLKVQIIIHCDKMAGHQGKHGKEGKLSWGNAPEETDMMQGGCRKGKR